jgi:hypothetical protein
MIGSASLTKCLSIFINTSIVYEWKVYEGIDYLPLIQSISLNSKYFVLNPYTLDISKNYTIQLIASIYTSKYNQILWINISIDSNRL